MLFGAGAAKVAVRIYKVKKLEKKASFLD